MSSQPLGELQGALDALGNVKLGKESSARGQAFDRVYGALKEVPQGDTASLASFAPSFFDAFLLHTSGDCTSHPWLQHALKALGYFVWQEQSQFERAHEDALLSRLLQCGRDAQKAGNKAVLVVCLWCLGVQQFSAAAVGDVFDDLLRFVVGLFEEQTPSATVERECMNTMMRLLAQAPTKMHASVGQWAPCVYGTLLAASTESAADTALDVLEKYCEETRGPWPVLRNIMYPEIESKIVPYMAKTYGEGERGQSFVLRLCALLFRVCAPLRAKLVGQFSRAYFEDVFRNNMKKKKGSVILATALVGWAAFIDMVSHETNANQRQAYMQVAKLPLARTLPAKGKTSYTEDMIMASLMAWFAFLRHIDSREAWERHELANDMPGLLRICAGASDPEMRRVRLGLLTWLFAPEHLAQAHTPAYLCPPGSLHAISDLLGSIDASQFAAYAANIAPEDLQEEDVDVALAIWHGMLANLKKDAESIRGVVEVVSKWSEEASMRPDSAATAAFVVKAMGVVARDIPPGLLLDTHSDSTLESALPVEEWMRAPTSSAIEPTTRVLASQPLSAMGIVLLRTAQLAASLPQRSREACADTWQRVIHGINIYRGPSLRVFVCYFAAVRALLRAGACRDAFWARTVAGLAAFASEKDDVNQSQLDFSAVLCAIAVPLHVSVDDSVFATALPAWRTLTDAYLTLVGIQLGETAIGTLYATVKAALGSRKDMPDRVCLSALVVCAERCLAVAESNAGLPVFQALLAKGLYYMSQTGCWESLDTWCATSQRAAVACGPAHAPALLRKLCGCIAKVVERHPECAARAIATLEGISIDSSTAAECMAALSPLLDSVVKRQDSGLAAATRATWASWCARCSAVIAATPEQHLSWLEEGVKPKPPLPVPVLSPIRERTPWSKTPASPSLKRSSPSPARSKPHTTPKRPRRQSDDDVEFVAIPDKPREKQPMTEHQRQKKAMQLMGKTSVPTTYTSLDASQNLNTQQVLDLYASQTQDGFAAAMMAAPVDVDAIPDTEPGALELSAKLERALAEGSDLAPEELEVVSESLQRVMAVIDKLRSGPKP